VPQHHARQRLDLGVGDRRALDPREILHLGLGELDVVNVLRAQRGDALLDLGRRQAIVVAVQPVEPDRKLTHRIVAAPFDLGEGLLDSLAHFRVDCRLLVGQRATLQPLGHVFNSCG
jgi:hypothetical protein